LKIIENRYIRYVLSLPDLYEGEQSTIASALGITRPTNFEPNDDDVGLSVSEGLKTGKLIRLRLSYRDVVNSTNGTKSALRPTRLPRFAQ